MAATLAHRLEELRTVIDRDLADAGLTQVTSAVDWPPHSRGYTRVESAAKALQDYQAARGHAPAVWYWHGHVYYLGRPLPRDDGR